jgi:lysozyme
MRQVNSSALAIIKECEGLRLEAYQDGGGVWTIGWGHTKSVKKGDKITRAQAEALLQQDLNSAGTDIEACVHVPLNDNQFSSLSSFVLNIGRPQFQTSTLLRELNAGHHDRVPMQLLRWNKDNGTVQNGLTRRRALESALWSLPVS